MNDAEYDQADDGNRNVSLRGYVQEELALQIRVVENGFDWRAGEQGPKDAVANEASDEARQNDFQRLLHGGIAAQTPNFLLYDPTT